MDLYIETYKVPKLISVEVKPHTRKTEIMYNTRGDMLIDQTARKYTVTAELGELSKDELQMISTLTSQIFFNLTFFSPVFGDITRQFHLSEFPAVVRRENYDGTPIFAPMKLVMEER